MHPIILSLVLLICIIYSQTTLVSSLSMRKTLFPNSQPPQTKDLNSLSRQLGQTAPTKAAIGIPTHCACRHGFSQAYAMDPLSSSTGRINSGMLKLTCPHLVNAVDALEDEGYISILNQELSVREEWQANVIDAHSVHAKARQELLDDTDLSIIRSKIGESGTVAFLEAGVAGASAGSTKDLKCLHAWLADYMFRGASACEEEEGEITTTPVGNAVVKALMDRGVDLSGTSGCCSTCDPNSGSVPLPPVPRNKQRLRTGKENARRKRRKREQRDAEGVP